MRGEPTGVGETGALPAPAVIVAWAAVGLGRAATAVLVLKRFGVPLAGLVGPLAAGGVALGLGAQRAAASLSRLPRVLPAFTMRAWDGRPPSSVLSRTTRRRESSMRRSGWRASWAARSCWRTRSTRWGSRRLRPASRSSRGARRTTSPRSNALLRRLAERISLRSLASLDRELVLLHVAGDASENVDAGAALRRELPEPTLVVTNGDPGEQLTTLARRRDAALLVVGTRGRGAVAAAVLGSVSSGVVDQAIQPVMLVGPAVDAHHSA